MIQWTSDRLRFFAICVVFMAVLPLRLLIPTAFLTRNATLILYAQAPRYWGSTRYLGQLIRCSLPLSYARASCRSAMGPMADVALHLRQSVGPMAFRRRGLQKIGCTP